MDIVIGIADPVAADDWNAEDLDVLNTCSRTSASSSGVRHALVRAEALRESLTGLLANALGGLIYLDRRGTIIKANARV